MILSTHISSQLSDTCRPTVSAHTESAGGWLQFLESSAFKWNSYKILQSSFQRKKINVKKYKYLSCPYKASPPNEGLDAQVPMCPSSAAEWPAVPMCSQASCALELPVGARAIRKDSEEHSHSLFSLAASGDARMYFLHVLLYITLETTCHLMGIYPQPGSFARIVNLP